MSLMASHQAFKFKVHRVTMLVKMNHRHQELSSGLRCEYPHRFTVRIFSSSCLKTIINKLLKNRVPYNTLPNCSFSTCEAMHLKKANIALGRLKVQLNERSWSGNRTRKSHPCVSCLSFRCLKLWVSLLINIHTLSNSQSLSLPKEDIEVGSKILHTQNFVEFYA